MAESEGAVRGRWLGLRAVMLAGVLLAGCAAPQSGQVVQVPAYVPGSVASPLSRVPRAIVQVRPFGELGAQAPMPVANQLFADAPAVEVFGVSPSAGRLLGDAVAAELLAAGHQPGGAGAPVVVEGGVQRFDVRASKTALYWATEVNVAAAVTVRHGGRSLTHAYVARCQDVAYATPGPDTMAPVVARCVGNIARQFRDDRDMAGVING